MRLTLKIWIFLTLVMTIYFVLGIFDRYVSLKYEVQEPSIGSEATQLAETYKITAQNAILDTIAILKFFVGYLIISLIIFLFTLKRIKK